MTFTRDQKIKALEQLGYTVTKERHAYYVPYNDSISKEQWATVWVVKFKDNLVREGYGDSQVDYVFEQELKKRILKLFENG